MKDFFLKNKRAASVILCAVILLSLFGGTMRSLSSQRSRLVRAYKAEDSFGESAKSTLEALAYHANSFLTSYISVVGSDEYSEEMSGAVRAVRDGADTSPAGLFAECRTIRQVSTDMYSRLVTDGKFEGTARAAYTSLDSDISILNNYTDYNDVADSYNAVVASFPASLFGFEKAAYFG